MPSPEVELTDRTIIDISHESLMRVWTRLRQWVEEEAQAARHLPAVVGKRGPARAGESGAVSRPGAGHRAGLAGSQAAQRRLGRALPRRF